MVSLQPPRALRLRGYSATNRVPVLTHGAARGGGIHEAFEHAQIDTGKYMAVFDRLVVFAAELVRLDAPVRPNPNLPHTQLAINLKFINPPARPLYLDRQVWGAGFAPISEDVTFIWFRSTWLM
ncbi:MAG: hypothetical protein SFV15_25715 [Polyangiaceae bacterium]|nr:hypothetical protein [Polyangiaceae bacterium]